MDDDATQRLNIIHEKQLEVVEALGRIEEQLKQNAEKIKLIEDHTKTMNHELGNCMDGINSCQERLTKIEEKKPFFNLENKLSKTDLGKISLVVGIVYTVLRIIMVVVFKIGM
jgi:chromosome segregation ATPase